MNKQTVAYPFNENYSVIKRNESPSHEAKNIDCILLSVRSQFEKAVYCMSSTI